MVCTDITIRTLYDVEKEFRNIILKEENNIWEINVEEDYHEELKTGRIVPMQKE